MIKLERSVVHKNIQMKMVKISYLCRGNKNLFPYELKSKSGFFEKTHLVISVNANALIEIAKICVFNCQNERSKVNLNLWNLFIHIVTLD